MIQKSTILLCLILLSIQTFAQNESTDESQITTKINVERNGLMINIHPTIQNHTTLYFEYNYLLLVRKTDSKNNLSVNRQSGRFTLEPHESKRLANTQVNLSDQQKIIAHLYIRDEEKNELIVKDSIEIEGMALSKVNETELMIRGLVIDETKTKFGSDFYDELFSMYNQLPEKFPFIITVTELPYRGQTSIISVTIDYDKIYEFFSNPDQEYTKQQAIIALKRIAIYSENKEKIRQEFNY